MNLVSAENVRIEMGIRTLLAGASFGIQSDERIALVGLNGCGKTTLLSMITGADTPNGGSVVRNSSATIHHVKQTPDFDPDMTVAEYIFKSDHPVVGILRRYEICCRKMRADNSAELAREFEFLSHELDRLDAWGYEGEIRAILNAFGIEDMEQALGTLSGGMAKKIVLAQAIIEDPDLLILDEPTNHLDIDTIQWLQWYLTKRGKALLMVTHDRYFLDDVCTAIWEIDQSSLYRYEGNYTRFLELKAARLQIEQRRDHKLERLLKHEIEWARKAPQGRATKQRARLDRVDELKTRTTLTEESSAQMTVTGRRLGKKILEAKHLNKSFDGRPVITDFSYVFKQKERIGLVGANGSGKTTLLNLLTGALAPDSGFADVGINTHYGIFSQHSTVLDAELTVLAHMKSIAEVIKLDDGSVITAADMLERFLFVPAMHHSRIGLLSGGEKRRLHLLSVLMTNPNFLVLDEPTNDLDIQTLSVLEAFLLEFNGCVLAVSHDRYFLDRVVDYLFVLDGSGAVTGFPSGCSDWLEAKKGEQRQEERMRREARDKQAAPLEAGTAVKRKRSFKENREFESILDEIAALESEKSELETLFASGGGSPEALKEAGARYKSLGEIIPAKELRWEELASLD